MSVLLTAVATLGAIGAGSAAILYMVGQKFKVEEDPRIQEVQDSLPAANCGGCGFPGCASFASACVKAESMDDLFCPVGGQDTMDKVATLLGRKAPVAAKKIAVVRCSGTCDSRPRLNLYDGASNCTIASALYGGDTVLLRLPGVGRLRGFLYFRCDTHQPVTLLPEVVETNVRPAVPV